MPTALANATRPGLSRLAVAVFLLGLLAASVSADPNQYLPSSAQSVDSIDFAAIRTSKTYLEVKKMIPRELEKDTDELIRLILPLSFGPGNFSRVIGGTVTTPGTSADQRVTILTAAQPVSVEDLKKISWNSSFNLFQSVTGHKEIKVGKFVVYQEIIRTNLLGGSNSDGDSGFCRVEPKVILAGNVALLKQILARNQKPALSANVQAGLQEAGSAVWSAVVDFEGVPKAQRAGAMDRYYSGLKELGDKLKYMVEAIKLSEDGSLQGSITLHCTSAAGAADARKLATAALAELRKVLTLDPTASRGEKKAAAEALTLVNGVKVSVTEMTVRITLDVGAAQLGRVIVAGLQTRGDSKPGK